jgi:predicted DNA-binding transcriptional regulator AlpA
MDEQFLSAKRVAELTSLSRATIDRLAKAGEFVKPVRVSLRRKVYPCSAVQAWMADRLGKDHA